MDSSHGPLMLRHMQFTRFLPPGVFFIPALALIITGCSSTGSFRIADDRDLDVDTDATRLVLTPLSQEENALASSLAHYARAVLSDNTFGRNSTQALHHIEAAVALDPKRHRIRSRHAMALLQAQKPDQAVQTLEEAVRANPREPKAWSDLGAVAQAVGKNERAIEAFEQALRMNPAQTFAYLGRAKALFETSRDGAALNTLETGFKRSTTPLQITLFLCDQGRAFVRQEQIARAIPCFELAAKYQESQRGRLYHLIGELHTRNQNPARAIEFYQLAVREPGADLEFFLDLAVAQIASDPKASVETMKKADELSPDNAAVLFMLATAYSRANDDTRAIATLEKAEALERRNKIRLKADFYLYFASICERVGKVDQAETVLKRCLELYPNNAGALNFLAYMWAEKGANLDQALEYVKRALIQEPDNGAYIDTLGWIYFKKARYREAIEHLKKARTLVGNDATIADHLGDAHSAMNDFDKAVAFWKESFLLDPKNSRVAEKLSARGVDTEKLRSEIPKEKERPEPSKQEGSAH